MLVLWFAFILVQSKNIKGFDRYWIDLATCIDCGICIQVCPVQGVIVPEERPSCRKRQ